MRGVAPAALLSLVACGEPVVDAMVHAYPELAAPSPPPPGPQRGTLEDPAAPDEYPRPLGPSGYMLGRTVHSDGEFTWIEISAGAHVDDYLRAWGIDFHSMGAVEDGAVLAIHRALPDALRRTFGERGEAFAAELSRYRGQYCEYGTEDRRSFVVGCLFGKPAPTWDAEPQSPDHDPDALCVEYTPELHRVTRLRLGDHPDWVAVPDPSTDERRPARE